MENTLEQAANALDEHGDKEELKWLTFWLDKQLFGFCITNVEQIVCIQPITAVPEYPAYAKGIINLRGAIIPVIDLGERLGKPKMQYTDHTCIIINSVAGEQLGFIVDEVDTVIEIPGKAITPPPKVGEESVNRYLMGIARIEGEELDEKLLLCLDAEKILLEDELKALKM